MNEIIKALYNIRKDITEVKDHLQKQDKSYSKKFKDQWVDGQEVMLSMNISKRTLQTLRDNGILPYSKIKGKFFYKASDLEALMELNYSGNNMKGNRNGNKRERYSE